MSNSKWQGYGDSVRGPGDGRYVNLKDKEQITFAIMGEPGEQHLLFPQGGGKPSNVRAGTPGAQHKIGIPIYDVKQNAARFLQLTASTFRELALLVAEFGEDRVYRVSRSGSGLMDTRYSVTSIDRIDATMKAKVAAYAMITLEEAGYAAFAAPVQDGPREPGDQDIPF